MPRIELPATLTAEAGYTYNPETSDTVEAVHLKFGGSVIKTWRVGEDEHTAMQQDPDELEAFIAAKLAALLKD